jgi:hypothetical protein
LKTKNILSFQARKMADTFPEECYCPITLEIMNEPVIAPDGHTYERKAIVKCLTTSGLSPMTRETMNVDSLIPNRALKSQIERLKSAAAPPPLDRSLPVPALDYKPKLVCLIGDLSGSMDAVCDRDAECRFTRKDLMGHAMKVVIASLQSKDRAMLTTFSSYARVLCRPILMTDANRDIIEKYIDNMVSEGQTNIWSALKDTMDTLLACPEVREETAHIMLFTDGDSNYNTPAIGIVPTLRNYLEQSSLNVVIHTFGFSNSIKSDLLYEISTVSKINGVFNFIPSADMIATVFINTLGYILTIDTPPVVTTEQKALIDEVLEILCLTPPSLAQNRLEIFTRRLTDRYIVIEEIAKAGFDMGISVGCNYIHGGNETNFARDLLRDCQDTPDPNLGQIHKALNSRYYDSWGKHYIYSVRSALNNQMVLNFKDMAVQHFKTPEFTEAQKHIEAVLEKVVPPKPSGGGHAMTSLQFTQQFYDPTGGCILQGTQCITSQGFIDVAELAPGDKVGNEYGGISTILCVLKLRYTGKVYRFGKSWVTAYHPVHLPGKFEEWFFPVESKLYDEVKHVDGLYVYDVVLDCGHNLQLGTRSNRDNFDITAITLGHNREHPVAKHDYFGTYKIVNDLRRHPDWKTGIIQLDSYTFLRGPDNLVCGIQY